MGVLAQIIMDVAKALADARAKRERLALGLAALGGLWVMGLAFPPLSRAWIGPALAGIVVSGILVLLLPGMRRRDPARRSPRRRLLQSSASGGGIWLLVSVHLLTLAIPSAAEWLHDHFWTLYVRTAATIALVFVSIWFGRLVL